MLAEARAYSETVRIEADNICKALTSKAVTRLETSKFTSKTLIHEADMELLQVENLEHKRKFTEKMKHSENLIRMVRSNKVIVGGENGDSLLEFFKDTNDLVFSDKKL